MKRILILMLVLALPLVYAGCSEDDKNGGTQIDPQASEDKTDLAVGSFMEEMGEVEDMTNIEDWGDADFTGAYNLFEEAVALDPTNLNAHAGAGAMNILRMPNHPAIGAAMDELGLGDLLEKSMPWRAMGFGKGTGPVTGASRAVLGSIMEPGQTDMGQLIDLLLGEVNISINHFNAVEADPDFQWLLPLPEGLGPDTLEIDVTDIHFAEAPLHLIRALLLGLDAYDLNLPGTDTESLAEALAPESDFLTLTNATSILSAGAALNTGAEEAGTAAQLLEDETDDQTDDFIRLLFPGEPMSEWPAMTEGMRDTLENMPTMMAEFMDTPLPIVEDIDGDEVPDTVLVNMGVLFNDPIADWKAILPDYTTEACDETTLVITWDATTVETWTWNVDELNGLIALPDGPMTSDDMVTMFGLEMLFYMGGTCPK
jgi:hypothetical protein